MLKDKEKGLEKVLLETEEREDVEAAALLQREQVITNNFPCKQRFLSSSRINIEQALIIIVD